MSWSVHNDNEKIYILILGKSPQYFLDGATLTAQKEHLINYSEQQKLFLLSLRCNRVSSYLFANAIKIYKFKVKKKKKKNLKKNTSLLCLGNGLKDFSNDNITTTGLNVYLNEFSADSYSIDVTSILNIHKYLIKKHDLK